MNQNDRIRSDWQVLDDLSCKAGFWTVDEPVDRDDSTCEVRVVIHGKAFAAPVNGDATLTETHDVRCLLDSDYPQSAPQIEIKSPVYHPNIAEDGIVSLEDIGIIWQDSMTLDIVVERIWDTLRCLHIDPENIINPGAGRWYTGQTKIPFPVDSRPLSSEFEEIQQNVVRYRRHGQQFRQLKTNRPMIIDDPAVTASDDSPIHFIE